MRIESVWARPKRGWGGGGGGGGGVGYDNYRTKYSINHHRRLVILSVDFASELECEQI